MGVVSDARDGKVDEGRRAVLGNEGHEFGNVKGEVSVRTGKIISGFATSDELAEDNTKAVHICFLVIIYSL